MHFFTLYFGQKYMHKVTAKKAEYLYSFFEQKNYLDSKLLKHFNYIEDEIEKILFPKFVQSILENHIKQ
jgi:hypothetical protein